MRGICLRLVASAVLLLSWTAAASASQTSPLEANLAWRPTEPPVNGDVAGAEWLAIQFPTVSLGERTIYAAVFRPEGSGPFPVVVYLHGSSGLTGAMLRWAPKLNAAGFLVVAGCYKLVLRVQDRIACPNGARSEDGLAALMAVAHQLPDAKQESIGVLGLSEGALWTYWLLDTRTDIGAAVADSAAPLDREIRGAADNVQAPVLLLASPQDQRTTMADVQEYERVLQAAAKPVESSYYPDGMHVVTLSQPTAEDASQRTIDFFRRHLH